MLRPKLELLDKETIERILAEAYELLIDEKVAANEAFVILQALIADVARELEERPE